MQLRVFRNTSTSPWTYTDLNRYQQVLTRALLENPDHSPELIFSELAPVVTYGRRTLPQSLENASAPVMSVDRGGLATWHGPGQWVIFPVLRMEESFGDRRAIKKAMLWLLESSLEVARIYHPEAVLERGDRLGVWTRSGKIASVGVSVREGILQHGLSFNVFPTDESFKGIQPCGLDAEVDFAVKEKSESVFISLKQTFASCLGQRLKASVFQCHSVPRELHQPQA